MGNAKGRMQIGTALLHMNRGRKRLFYKMLTHFILTYIPVLTAAISTAFCLCRALGGRLRFFWESAIMIPPFYFVFALTSSHYMGFCRFHRTLIWYSFITDCCIMFEKYIGFGQLREYFNWVFFVWGCYLCIRTAYLIGAKKKIRLCE